MTDRQGRVDPWVGELAGVILAAGEGRRLRPLTFERPKALCPVDNRALLDLAVDRLAPVTTSLAVNTHHGRQQVETHVERHHPSVHLSVEEPVALGTAGALGQLRPWVDGRAVLVTNADAWLPLPIGAIESFVDGWDGERSRLLCVQDASRGDFGTLRYAGLALLPWALVGGYAAEPAGLYEVSWRAATANGHLDLVQHDGPFIDCGTVADYLAANLAAAGAAAVIAPGAEVLGEVERCVVWTGARVGPDERLVDAVRTPHRTVLVR